MVASFKGYADIVQILIEEKTPKVDIKDKVCVLILYE